MEQVMTSSSVPQVAELVKKREARVETAPRGEERADGAETTVLPTPLEMGRAALGFTALGVCAALGASSAQSAAGLAPNGLIVQAGALVLTGPALLVGHQFLGLEASVPSLVDAMARAFVRTGTVALGLVPAVLFFSATSGLAPVLFGLAMVGMGANGLLDAMLGMRDAERAAGDDKGRGLREAKIQLLALGWAVLAGLIGIRIAFGLGGV